MNDEVNELKIISIRMKNFGPYVNEMIDFRELNEQRLFLLERKNWVR